MKDWLKWVLLGVLSILFGVFALGAPIIASVAVTLSTGILFLISGGAQIVLGFGATGTGNKIFGVLLGAMMAFLGWSFIAHPLEGTLTLSLVFIILFLISGVTRMVWALQARGSEFFWPMLIMGLLTLVLAVVVLANYGSEPTSLLPLLGILMGIELLLNGIGLVSLGLFLRKAQPEA
ncbi:MAG: DUF308 domain-containing protein [Marinibacterium sp.]|nr:DUF308 domain-containing protein [Marinibacterium sp.]